MAETKPRVAADEDDSEGPITDVLLAKISSNLGQEYFTLGIMLKVPRPYMNRIDGDYVGNMIRKSFEVLDKWRTMSYKDGTTVTVMIEQLIKALADVDRADVGDLVRREVFPPDRIQRPEVTCDETDYDEVRRVLLNVAKSKMKTKQDQVRTLSSRSEATETPEQIITQVEELARSVAGETVEDKKQRVLRVLHLINERRKPELWSRVSGQLLSRDGHLNLSGALTVAALPDLLHLLHSGAAHDVTLLNIGATFTCVKEYGSLPDVFNDTDRVKSLCIGLAKMPKLCKLGFVSCELTDNGFGEICRAIRADCKQLTWLGCWGNNKLTSSIKEEVSKTMTELPRLRIYLYDCSLSADCCKRLHQKFRGRIYVDL